MIETNEQAISIIKDSKLPERAREDAILFLETHPSGETTEALLDLLDDIDPGVRWAASEVLAGMGDDAISPILSRLMKPTDMMFRNSVHRILENSRSAKVRNETKSLQHALKSPGGDLITMEEAYKTLQRWK